MLRYKFYTCLFSFQYLVPSTFCAHCPGTCSVKMVEVRGRDTTRGMSHLALTLYCLGTSYASFQRSIFFDSFMGLLDTRLASQHCNCWTAPFGQLAGYPHTVPSIAANGSATSINQTMKKTHKSTQKEVWKELPPGNFSLIQDHVL